jgi:hypothetical protein
VATPLARLGQVTGQGGRDRGRSREDIVGLLEPCAPSVGAGVLDSSKLTSGHIDLAAFIRDDRAG